MKTKELLLKMSKHTDKYYQERYKKIKIYAKQKGIKNPYRSWRDFKSDYLEVLSTGEKKVMNTIKYNLQYNTSYKTALAAYQAAREEGKNYTLKEIKMMTTTEFARENKDLIMKMYKEKMAEGKKAGEAGDFISNYWFGSE